MDDIKIYDYSDNMKLIYVVGRYISSNWTVNYCDIGSFELHIDMEYNSDFIEILLHRKHLMAVQEDLQSMITGFQLGNEAVIYGRTLNHLLSWRVIPSPQASTESTNIDAYIGGFFGVGKIYDFMSFKSNAAITETAIFKNDTYKSGDEVFKPILAENKLGYEVKYDFKSKKYVYSNLHSAVSNLCISAEYNNVTTNTYDHDFKSNFNVGYYDDKDTNAWASMTRGTQISGINKRETVLKARNSAAAKTEINNAVDYRKTTAQTQSLIYRKDYNLGDIVNFQAKYGSLVMPIEKKLITGVTLWWENNNIGQSPIMEDSDG